ncbi:hypothetical protein P9112_014660 [Eukaryota sp. TZLM1-RC]
MHAPNLSLDSGKPELSIPLLYKITQWTLLSIVIAVSLFFLYGHAFSDIRWDEGYAQAGCTRTNTCFCEFDNRDSFCRQRSNAWSSLGFTYAGTWMLFDITRCLSQDCSISLQLLNMLMMSLISILLGIGSYLYHATLTLWGERLDGAGMHFIGVYLAIFTLSRMFNLFSQKLKKKSNVHLIFAIVFYPAFIAISIAVIIVERWGKLTWVMIGINIGIVFIIEPINCAIEKKRISNYYLLAASCFAASFLIWNLDRSDFLCYPHSWFQGHAVWHLGLAVSVYALYQLYSKYDHE